jgi:hypothetical protein
MPVHIYCKTCDREFTPTGEKLMEMIRTALASKTDTLVLHCEACARCESTAPSLKPAESKTPRVRLMRCPEAGCPGWVVQFEDSQGKHFDCGECGAGWESQLQLDRAIDRILERFDHRLCCYRMVDGSWAAAPPEQESPKLDARIASEA